MCLYVYADMEMYSFPKMRWKMCNITTAATTWLLLCHWVRYLWALIRLSGSLFPFIHGWNVVHRFCHSYNRYSSSWWAFNILQPITANRSRMSEHHHRKNRRKIETKAEKINRWWIDLCISSLVFYHMICYKSLFFGVCPQNR